MCPDSANDDNGEEKRCYNACYTVENDHGYCSSWRLSEDIAVIVIAATASIDGILIHVYGSGWEWRIILLQSSHHCLGLISAKHGVDVCKGEAIGGAERARCGVDAVEHNCVRFVVHR